MIEILDFLIAFLILTFLTFNLNVNLDHYPTTKLDELKILNKNYTYINNEDCFYKYKNFYKQNDSLKFKYVCFKKN